MVLDLSKVYSSEDSSNISDVSLITFQNGVHFEQLGPNNLTCDVKEEYSKLLTVLPNDHPDSFSSESDVNKERRRKYFAELDREKYLKSLRYKIKKKVGWD